jgi:hypothetical protein
LLADLFSQPIGRGLPISELASGIIGNNPEALAEGVLE